MAICLFDCLASWNCSNYFRSSQLTMNSVNCRYHPDAPLIEDYRAGDQVTVHLNRHAPHHLSTAPLYGKHILSPFFPPLHHLHHHYLLLHCQNLFFRSARNVASWLGIESLTLAQSGELFQGGFCRHHHDHDHHQNHLGIHL